MSESIYNLVPREAYIPEKKAIHRSSHDPQGIVSGSTFGCFGSSKPLGAGEVIKKDGAYFGPPKPEYGLPSGFSTKKKESLYKKEDTSVTIKRRDPVPSRYEKPVMGITTSKNYVTANAVEAILQVPKQVAGNDLNYSKKEDFGKVPAYLTQVKEEIRRENEMIEKYIKEQMGEVERTPDIYEEMSEEERQTLVLALKKKWDHVNSQYQKITHLVLLDTTGQVRRKENFENELNQIEKDIEKLERASNVLIKPY